MFKFFYKTFLIILVSVTLTAFDFSVAYAEAAATATSAQGSNMSRDSNGVVRRTETHHTDKVEDDDMMASLAMFAAVGATTQSFLMSATKPMDLMIAGAGALALLAGEVMATMGDKTELEAMSAEVTKSSDGKSDQAQIDLLNTQKKSYESAKKALQTKKGFQSAAGVVYFGAAAVLVVQLVACAASTVAYAACVAPYYLTADNKPELMNKSLYGGRRMLAQHSLQIPQDKKSLSDKFFNLLIPRADAGILPIALGIGGAAMGIILPLFVSTKLTLDIPFVRVGGWIAVGALCMAAASATQNQMDKVDDNIKKIDKILVELNTLQKGTQLNKMTEQQIKLGSLQEKQTEDLKLNADPKIKSDCLLSEGSDNCKSIADTIQAMPSFQNLPDSLKSLGTQAGKLGDGLSGTNTVSASTLSTANSLAGKKDAIKKLKDFTQRKLNEALEKEKKPKMDLDKESAKILSKWKANAVKELKSHNMTPSEFLASVGASPVSSTAKVLDTVAKKKVEVASVIGAAPTKAKEKDDLNFDFKESPKESEAAALASDVGANATPRADLDIGSNDINTDSDVNIFQLISNRYFKSGYPKLLEEVPVKK